ncbi:MAG: YhbY family RNA-binding protein [Pleomorphochaeta sp.]
MKSNLRNYLRAQAHNIDPIVMVGKDGVSDNVIYALDQALLHHELVKVRFQAKKEFIKELSNKLALETKSDLIYVIGFTAIFYRKSEDNLIEIPKSLLR